MKTDLPIPIADPAPSPADRTRILSSVRLKTILTLFMVLLLVGLSGLMFAMVSRIFNRLTPSIAEDLVVIVNAANPVRELDAAQLEEIFTAAARNWPDQKLIVSLNYAPDDKLRLAFDAAVLRMTPEEVGRFWVDQRVRGGPRPPRQVPDPIMVVRLVGKLPGAIGYVPVGLPVGLIGDAGVRVVARITDGKVIKAGSRG